MITLIAWSLPLAFCRKVVGASFGFPPERRKNTLLQKKFSEKIKHQQIWRMNKKWYWDQIPWFCFIDNPAASRICYKLWYFFTLALVSSIHRCPVFLICPFTQICSQRRQDWPNLTPSHFPSQWQWLPPVCQKHPQPPPPSLLLHHDSASLITTSDEKKTCCARIVLSSPPRGAREPSSPSLITTCVKSSSTSFSPHPELTHPFLIQVHMGKERVVDI